MNCPKCNSGLIDTIIKTEEDESSPFFGKTVEIIICRSKKNECNYNYKKVIEDE